MAGRKGLSCAPIGRRIGTSFDSVRWLSLDVCGLLGVSCSWTVHLFSFSVLSTTVVAGSMFATAVFVLLYTPCSLLAMASLYMAWTTDPGAVPMGARPLTTVRRAASGDLQQSPQNSRRRALRRCHKCADNYKPPRAHHDSVTGRCIVKFDHFCPWVGNAVGALNHKFFVLFIGYTLCTCILSLCLLILRAIHCGYSAGDGDDSVSKDIKQGGHLRRRLLQTTEGTAIHLPECIAWQGSFAALTLAVVSLIFLVFTCTMLFDQIEAIETNTSKIARMKMSVGQAGTELSRVTEEFNEMFGGDTKDPDWHWFLPIPVQFPRGMKKVVLGYEWDVSFESVPYDDDSSEDTPDASETRIEMVTTRTTTPDEATTTIPAADHDTEDGNGSADGFNGSSNKHPALVKRSNSKSLTIDDSHSIT